MTRERYPLEAARTLRQTELDAAQTELTRRVLAHAEAEAAVARALDARRAFDEETRIVEAREAAADARGRTALDMMRARDFLAHRRAESAALATKIEEARRAVAAAEAEVHRAREALAQARAEREAVEKHREAWQEAQHERAEARAEAEVDDLVAASIARDRSGR